MLENFVKAEMLIRRDLIDVFEAFINPDITTKIWFTKSSGRLEAGQSVNWIWEMYNHSIAVKVLEVIPNQKIKIDWVIMNIHP